MTYKSVINVDNNRSWAQYIKYDSNILGIDVFKMI